MGRKAIAIVCLIEETWLTLKFCFGEARKCNWLFNKPALEQLAVAFAGMLSRFIQTTGGRERVGRERSGGRHASRWSSMTHLLTFFRRQNVNNSTVG
jgi:hypothetical protein